MSKITPVVCVAIVRDHKFLLTKRAEWDVEDYDQSRPWQFPGGGLEFAESVEECAHREIREEVGVEIKNLKLVPQIFQEVRRSWHGLIICFSAELVDVSAKVVLNSEASDWGWFSLAEVKALPCLSKTHELAELVAAGK